MMDTSRKELQTMHGMKFLAAWLLFGVLIELSVVMSGVFCVAAKQADERMQMCFPLETNEKEGHKS